MKKLLLLVLTISLLIASVACSNKITHQPNQNIDNVQNEPQYTDLGANDVKIIPIDEANQNADFKKFRDELLTAINKKDLEFIKKHTDPTIKYTFGINENLDGFLKSWNLDSTPNESEFWNELNEVLILGGTFNDSERTIFTAPYTFTKFPENFDAFQYNVIIDKNVKVYSEPDLNSNVEGVLSYSLVKVLQNNVKSFELDGKSYSWQKIETQSGKSGYVIDKYSRSHIDYRASFKNIDGTWKMIFFVAGD